MKNVTIHEIARALNVNSSTVSRALNDSDRVTAKTKRRVLEKAKEMGYQRNMLASNLRRKKSNTIGVVVPRISRHFFSSTIAGIEETAYKFGFNVIICQSLEELEKEELIIENLISNRVDGILISVSMGTKKGKHLANCLNNRIPVVFFDRHLEGFPSMGKVLIDDQLGAFRATEHLILKGCKKIGHFSGPKNLHIYKNRLEGYKIALEKYIIPYDESYVLTSKLMKTDGLEMAKKLLEKHSDLDGLFCANDTAAVGAFGYFKKIGKRVPEDIAIVGFSNEPFSALTEPSLTTIDQSGEEIGKAACKLLLQNISSGNTLITNETVILNPMLIERGSSQR